MSWIISKKDNCILEGFKRIFKPKDITCENLDCTNIICYYFDCQGNKTILCVCDEFGKKLPSLGYIEDGNIFCSDNCFDNCFDDSDDSNDSNDSDE